MSDAPSRSDPIDTPSPNRHTSLVLTGVTAVLGGVFAIVALNNATEPDVLMPLAIVLAAGLIALGIAARGS
jgi:hypothetical protein